MAANAPVYVDPDKLFGRHVAVLGNTGSGKSCSVAGLIRWSLNAAEAKKEKSINNPNARFIILDPNGEYTNSFNDVASKVRRFSVAADGNAEQLKVPVWMWNSYEWSSITQASGRTQRPLLRRALRELRSGNANSTEDVTISVRRYYSSCLIEVKKDYRLGASA
ncbi:MAG: helicase HerA domain-containing protein, partial [Promethearchaeota archaeon]